MKIGPTLSTPSVHLAPPGAGLPEAERLVAGLIFRWHCFTTSRTQAAAQIVTERDGLLALVKNCPPEKRTLRVLIPRLRGMEDSSRNWSVLMTLEHVRIVNAGFEQVITLLAQGRVPPHAASTAAVKPSPEAGPKVVEAFVQGCDSLARTVAALSDLHTSARYRHPWFGSLDAAGWHALAGSHMQLHRRQVESIVKHIELSQSVS